MLKNPQRDENPIPSSSNGELGNPNSSTAISSITNNSSINNSASSISSNVINNLTSISNSSGQSSTISTISGGDSSIRNGTSTTATIPTSISTEEINGINNNHQTDHENGELPSTVDIEIVENNTIDEEEIDILLTADEMETTLDDGAGSSSHDDGMISSSAATSTSSSVISIDRAPIGVQQQQPAAAAAAIVAIDQPEVTDFLDMDFDVEPTSTDDDEDDRSQSLVERRDKPRDQLPQAAAAAASSSGEHQRRTTTCSHEHIFDGQYGSNDGDNEDGEYDFDADDFDPDEPSTSYAVRNESSTAPKDGRLVRTLTSTDASCVHGCRACNSESASSTRSEASKPISNVTILGELPSTSSSAANSTANASSSTSVSSFDVRRYAHGRHLYSRFVDQPLISRWNRNPNANNVIVGGPDGIRLARSAYVAFPTNSGGGGGGKSTGPDGRSPNSAAALRNAGGYTYRIWTIDEAEAIQTTQIGPSACGATALINVFKALGLHAGLGGTSLSTRDVEREVPTRLRANDAPVAEYLLSRSVAGTDADDLIEAADRLTDSRVLGRFFPMTEETIMTEAHEEEFGRWLLSWLKNGAIPVLTLNMQRGLMPIELMPDAWHHQMAFGVCTRTGGVFLTNPLECVPLRFLKHALCSPSVLLAKTEDVRQRWNGRAADLSPLFASASSRTETTDRRAVDSVLWTEMNVIGQIARALRQTAPVDPRRPAEPILTHVAIPARYRSGVALYARAESEVWTLISTAPDIDTALRMSTVEQQNRSSSTSTNVPADMDECEEASSVVIMCDSESMEDVDSTEPMEETVENGNGDQGDHENGESQSCDLM